MNATTDIRSTDMPESCDDMKKLRKRFEVHLDEHRVDAAEYQELQLRQSLAHEEAMKNISELTVATKGLVDAWNAASTIQRFFKWLSGFAVLVAIITWAVGYNPFK